MYRRNCRVLGLLQLLVVAGIIGCESSTDGTYSLTGTVTIGTQPLKDGAVAFLSKSGQIKNATVALDGTYRVELQPGTYRVGILPTADSPSKENIRSQFERVNLSALVPTKYTRPATSGIVVLVRPQDDNLQDFEL